MKIKDVYAAAITDRGVFSKTKSSKAKWWHDLDKRGDIWDKGRVPPWGPVVCVVTAEDGTWGLGMSTNAGPVASIINDHFAPFLKGQSCMATEKLSAMMAQSAVHYSAGGLASYAISAVDLALWDLKGKLLKTPVYELLGGPVRDKIFCYATGDDLDWYKELGFQAMKLGGPKTGGPAPGRLAEIEEMVSRARDLIGPERELMLDCWAIESDQEYIVRLAERLRPYNLKWLEDYLLPEDLPGYRSVRRRIPWQTLASGERWYTPVPFSAAISDEVVDILQPDVQWVGGATALVKICHMAEAAGIQVMPHLAASDAYGQHVAYAMPAATWAECLVITAPGESLDDGYRPTPGMAFPKDGYLVPTDAPGFGIELTKEDLEAAVR